MSSVLITLSQVEQWANIWYFCRLIGISYRSFQNILKENLSVLCVGACLHKICAMHSDRGSSRDRVMSAELVE